MKETMIAMLIAASTGCGSIRGLTIDSTQKECEDILNAQVIKFCEGAATNRDKVNAVEAILNQ